jgi:hypothetical protein
MPDEEGLARRYSDEAGSSFSYAHPRQAVIFGISIRVLFWSMISDFVIYGVFRMLTVLVEFFGFHNTFLHSYYLYTLFVDWIVLAVLSKKYLTDVSEQPFFMGHRTGTFGWYWSPIKKVFD